eukprot:TRINITY_DN1111_c0_g1_i1.p1 TRINITY_DN1111_c0_g1~~TRINITY_DN1111_c0_g1_i1.p1  ORF type:complete len:217 (-),score=23.52 TRINITY_DN1111_c0_g1_i1:187-837(-)
METPVRRSPRLKDKGYSYLEYATYYKQFASVPTKPRARKRHKYQTTPSKQIAQEAYPSIEPISEPLKKKQRVGKIKAGKVKKPQSKSLSRKKAAEVSQSIGAQTRWKESIATEQLLSLHQGEDSKSSKKVEPKRKLKAVVHAVELESQAPNAEEIQQEMELDKEEIKQSKDNLIQQESLSKRQDLQNESEGTMQHVFPIFSYVYGRFMELIFPEQR